MDGKQKKFLDTVHGYITIPEEYCDKIIDTIEFQRLRRIEQTSSRSIFPCARHDRFIHSLGVYHIGNKIYIQIKGRCDSDTLRPEEWKILKETYRIACLLHDCGHSPFSHTFEKYYDKPAILSKKLQEIINDEEFIGDFDSQPDSAPHERLSAILLLERFKDIITQLGGDPILAVRMIIGCKYVNVKDNLHYKTMANCFINLLNGTIIDADKIDYVCRDKWASGYSATNVDIERLISSIHLKRKDSGFFICYDKNALYEIQSVIDVKNFQYLYVISHHKVVYDQYILDKAIEKLATILFPKKNKEEALSKLFDYASFFNPINIRGKHCLYLPSDDDLIHLLKHYINENGYAKEWFSRTHTRFPLWKSRTEFLYHFRGISLDKLEKSKDKMLKPALERFFSEKKISYEYIEATPRYTTIDENEVKIDINGDVCSFTNLDIPNGKIEKKFFFYIFISNMTTENKTDLINDMKRVIEEILN